MPMRQGYLAIVRWNHPIDFYFLHSSKLFSFWKRSTSPSARVKQAHHPTPPLLIIPHIFLGDFTIRGVKFSIIS